MPLIFRPFLHTFARDSVMSTSIKDIARAAGVSHSTVSRALSGNPLISAATRARIQRLAAEMGYSPDAGARGLVMRRTCSIGVVVTTIADPWAAEVVEGIENMAYAHGYSVILAASQDDPEREVAAVDTLHSKRVDAVIVTSSRVGALHQERLAATGVPVILLNNHSQQLVPQTLSVRVDDVHGGRLATEHLLTLGHRRIAHVAGPANHSSSADRLTGYRAALRAAGLPFDEALILPGTGRPAAGEQALPALLALAERPTAVFCYNDMTAIGLLRAARQAGLHAPGDLAVVGFDDIPFAAYTTPALTTIAQPKFEMGQRAMQMALSLMAGPATDGAPNIILEGRLVVRESTAGIRQPVHDKRG